MLVTNENMGLCLYMRFHHQSYFFQDYKQEFTRTKANLVATLERRDLLKNVRRDISDYRDGSSGSRSRMDILLKESDHIRNSERLIDDQVKDHS